MIVHNYLLESDTLANKLLQLTNKAGTTFSLLLTKVEKKHPDILVIRLKTVNLYKYCSFGIKKRNLYCMYICHFVKSLLRMSSR